MDAYEATRIVFSRIQNLDPENAAKIMGLLLIQDHGEKEMIRLAFGPEALLHSVVIKVRKDLCLLPSSSPATPSAAGAAVFSRQNSARFLPVSPSSWSAAPHFSRTASAVSGDRSPTEDYPSYGGGGDLIDDLQLHDHLSFLNEGANARRTKSGEFFYSDIIGDLCSPGEGMLLSNSTGWVPTNRRPTAASITDLSLNSDLSCGAAGFGWRPCLYFARGFCKNGNACRFLHDDAAADQELLLRSKSSSKLMASAASFPYSPTSTIPPSPSNYSAKYMNFLLQQQHDGHRAAAAAAALMLSDDHQMMHNFMGRTTRSEFAAAISSNPASRQIYLTFPADSTFREEDVSNYFSIYGPVQDVRIPYQQKRMFGFVTFLYPDTVKLILAKGNPHFVCDARVLVKPYKEKGKVPDKKQQQQQADQRLDFSWNSAGLDSPVELGGRMVYGDGAQDASSLRRRLEEQQQQQSELLQQAIELQGRRFQLMELNLKPRSFSAAVSATALPATAVSPAKSADEHDNSAELQVEEELSTKEEDDFPVCTDEHNLPDSPFASPTKATGGAGAGNHLPFSPLSSCFFQIPARFSPGHGALGI